ncbi:hypothetical protein D0Y65_023989 [Glycine soja]|uniref:Uncharacterized protein n=1 Tax=Glycine soja TaxID=3848 RepID=A0A445J0D8_GLYSO|nr:hypothetical protein D0Y65_023989 [Glycine soja]
MVRRLLGSQAKDLDESQRENNFHTRCLIHGKLASCITVNDQGVNHSWQAAPRRDVEGFIKEEEEGICYFDHADDTSHIML